MKTKKNKHLNNGKNVGSDNFNNQEASQQINQDQVNQDIDYKDKYLRLLAEYTNFTRLKEEEIKNLSFLANKNILLMIMDILDDLELFMKQELSKETKDLVDFINSKLLHILELQGIRKLDIKIGDKYNPETCEVVHTIENPEMKDKIIDIVRNGYSLKDTVIRIAKVVVGK